MIETPSTTPAYNEAANATLMIKDFFIFASIFEFVFKSWNDMCSNCYENSN